jgi:proline dehydrogenase
LDADAADELVKNDGFKYNKEKAIVFNLRYEYRWDRLNYLRELHDRYSQ